MIKITKNNVWTWLCLTECVSQLFTFQAHDDCTNLDVLLATILAIWKVLTRFDKSFEKYDDLLQGTIGIIDVCKDAFQLFDDIFETSSNYYYGTAGGRLSGCRIRLGRRSDCRILVTTGIMTRVNSEYFAEVDVHCDKHSRIELCKDRLEIKFQG